jgi:hypothetical protein
MKKMIIIINLVIAFIFSATLAYGFFDRLSDYDQIIIGIGQWQDMDDFAGGTGTLNDPYQVSNFYHLNNVRNNLSAYYILTTDLGPETPGFSELASNTANDGSGWEPIGFGTDNRFVGFFDGDGKTITGLYIDRPLTDNVGLFGHVGVSISAVPTIIENICLIDVDITGNRGTGALVGRVTGNQSTLIQNACVVFGSVSGTGATGGLVGSNNSFQESGAADRNPRIETSFAKVDVIGRGGEDPLQRTFEKIGGLVGCSQKGTVAHSYSLSTVIVTGAAADRVGGLAGCNILVGILNNSYAAPTIDIGDTNSTAVGVLIGRISDGNSANRGQLTTSYFDNSLNGTLAGIGAAGANPDAANAIGLTTSQMTGTNAQTHMTAFNFSTTWMTVDGGYPILRSIDENIQRLAQGLDPLP